MFKTKAELKKAINLYCFDKNKCILKFGYTNEWNVLNITDMSCVFMDSKFDSNISNWNINSLIYGREEIIHLGAKEIEEINIIEKIKEEYEECPVTKEFINGNYLKCKTCNYCFSLEVNEWIKQHKKCPYCRSKWGKIIIYSQS